VHHILLVEDSPEFQKLVSRSLGHHKITVAESVDEASRLLRQTRFDLVLLDISLPKRDGYALLSEIQSDAELSGVPVICLTGKTEVTDKVTAFSLGADDYIVKPFHPIELKARVDGRLNKHGRRVESESLLKVANLEIDRTTHRVTVRDGRAEREVKLTQTEFKLLCLLVARPEQVYSRDQLLVAAWGEDADVLDRAVDVHLCSLRKKLGVCGAAIEAVPGIGYRFADKRKAA
jgi:DNA-binding response OmpR family regulator